MKPFEVIAIDGPAASGKSTVARRVAKALGWNYVDSGSMYRGVTWWALEKQVDVSNPQEVISLMEETEWYFDLIWGAMCFQMDGTDPGIHIRSDRVAAKVSHIAAIPEVRHIINENMRSLKNMGNLVVEGRDIGSVVFPDAILKFYLDADPAIRAKRRSKEEEGESGDEQTVGDALRKRDEMDSQRKTAPLQIALGAEVVDTTHLTVDDVVDRVLQRVEAHRLENHGAE